MLFMQLLLISVSLALDAFSVSVANGIKTQKATIQTAVKIALYFGGFQAFMPLVGWSIGNAIKESIMHYGPWIAFVLLFVIGVKMIKESFAQTKDKEQIANLDHKTLLFLAVATSIDALVVGITLEFLQLPLVISILCIGLITFVLSFVGFLFGKKLGSFFEGKVEIIGGVTLIAIGAKILVEHLFF